MTPDLAALVSRLHGLSSDCELRQKWADSATAHKAAAAIESLAARLEQLDGMSAWDTLNDEFQLTHSLRKRAERAEAERDALRQDAERYQWLRMAKFNKAEVCVAVDDWGGSPQLKCLRGRNLDAAIDAAIREAAKS